MMVASLVGCSSASSDNSNNVLTVGITAQMNGVFSPLYYESAYDAYAINLIYQSMLQYDENEELRQFWLRSFLQLVMMEKRLLLS